MKKNTRKNPLTSKNNNPSDEMGRYWSDIIALMSDLIFILDKDERFTLYYTPVEGKLYATPQTFIGKKISEIMPPHFSLMFKEALEKNRKGDTAELEYWLEIEGEMAWFSAKVSPLFSGKKFNGTICIVKDITEWKNAEISLRESEEKFRILSEKSPNMIYIGDGKTILYVNTKVEELLGYSKEEIYMEGFDFKSILDKRSIKIAEEMFTRCLNGEEVTPYKLFFISKTGKQIEILNSLAAIEYEKKKVIVGIGVEVTDILETKMILEEREKNFQTVVDNANDGIMVAMGKSEIVYANNMASLITGFSPGELLQMQIKDIAHPDEITKLLACRFSAKLKLLGQWET